MPILFLKFFAVFRPCLNPEDLSFNDLTYWGINPRPILGAEYPETSVFIHINSYLFRTWKLIPGVQKQPKCVKQYRLRIQHSTAASSDPERYEFIYIHITLTLSTHFFPMTKFEWFLLMLHWHADARVLLLKITNIWGEIRKYGRKGFG